MLAEVWVLQSEGIALELLHNGCGSNPESTCTYLVLPSDCQFEIGKYSTFFDALVSALHSKTKHISFLMSCLTFCRSLFITYLVFFGDGGAVIFARLRNFLSAKKVPATRRVAMATCHADPDTTIFPRQ